MLEHPNRFANLLLRFYFVHFILFIYLIFVVGGGAESFAYAAKTLKFSSCKRKIKANVNLQIWEILTIT